MCHYMKYGNADEVDGIFREKKDQIFELDQTAIWTWSTFEYAHHLFIDVRV